MKDAKIILVDLEVKIRDKKKMHPFYSFNTKEKLFL
jgi:hypothetical protein